MRRALILVILSLVLVSGSGLTSAAPAPGRGAVEGTGWQKALRHFVPNAQTSSDEDELQDLELAPVDSSLDPDDMMRSRPFVIGDDADQAFPIGSLPSMAPTEDEARDLLRGFLEKRGVDGGAIDDAVAKYDSRKVKRIVPSPTLRSALLMLTDWNPYEATIHAVLDGDNPSAKPYTAVVFEEIGFAGAIATLLEDPRDGKHTMVVGTDYENERPEQLIPVIVHESLHGGDGNSAEEEIIANILDTICYSEVLAVDPDLAYLGSDLTFFNNLELLGLINSSGRNGPGQVGIATSPVGDVFVGEDFADFDYESIRDVVEADGFYDSLLNNGSPGQQTTVALVGRFPGGKALGDAPRYGEAMLAVIDRGVGRVVTPERVVQIAALFGLEMTTKIAEKAAAGKIGTKLTLESRPFVPRDSSYFDHRVGKKAGKLLSEAAGRKALAAFLKKAEATPELTTALLARYDDPGAVALIADPSLRAATLMLGALKPWDGALGVIFDGNNPDGAPLQVMFADLRSSAPAAHQSDTNADGTPPAILINSLIAGESPVYLASIIVEGTLLHDDTWTDQEAIAAALMGTLAYADIIEVDSSIIKAKTWGVTNRNRDLLALLNSASFSVDAPENADLIGFLSAPNEVDDILPGLYADALSFADYTERMPYGARFDRHAELEVPPVFIEYLAFAGIQPTTQFRGVITFSEETMAEVDAQLSALITPEDALRVAKTLKLGVAARR